MPHVRSDALIMERSVPVSVVYKIRCAEDLSGWCWNKFLHVRAAVNYGNSWL